MVHATEPQLLKDWERYILGDIDPDVLGLEDFYEEPDRKED